VSDLPAPPGAGQPLKVFVSYSHQDDALRERLDVHLSLLKRQGVLEVWHDRRLQGGEHWEEAIDQALEEADIVLLLISPDFIASDYCYGRELTAALERDRRGEAVVVPLLLHPCDWQSAPFARCQAFPRDNQPISVHPRGENAAFSLVSAELRRLAESLRKRRRDEARHPPSRAERDPGGPAAERRWRWKRWWLAPLAALGVAVSAGMLLSQARVAAGLADLRLGAYASALTAFQGARLLNPLHPLARCGARAATIGSGLAAVASHSPELARAVAALPQSGPCGAQRELFHGDLTLERYLLNRDPKDWDRAAAAFERALVMDPELAEAEQRLGTLADLQNDLPAARDHFESAKRLAEGQPLLASRYRNGLAKVLLQGSPADRERALVLFDGDRGNPASDVEAAMQRWRQGGGAPLGQALERLPAEPPPSLRGEGGGEPWGFKLRDGQAVALGLLRDQRCLLAQARAATLHMDGQLGEANSERARSRATCSGSASSINQVICDRLGQPATSGAPTTATRAWLRCADSGG
jgi:tetratricopeptide (TPR) repeat protein